MSTILIVAHSPENMRAIRDAMETRSEWTIIAADSMEEMQLRFQQNAIDLLVLDLAGPQEEGRRILDWLCRSVPRLPVVLLTEANDSAAVEVILMGAASYVPRSRIARDLHTTVERILGLAGCRRRHARLKESLLETETAFELRNNELPMIQVLVGHLLDTAEDFEVCTSRNRTQVAVALEEAMSNGVIHGNLGVPSHLRDLDDDLYHRLIEERRLQEPYRERRLYVHGSFRAGESRFTISDEGAGYNPKLVGDPTLPSNLDRPYGRGLFLIRAFMDEVSFNAQANEIRLVKRATKSGN